MDQSFFDAHEEAIPRGGVRTRFAPSPTGYMHVGNLRTALYTYCIAKQAGGVFLLRLEDTDRERLIEGADELIYRTMRSAGLEYDEGPDVGGPVGPYVQSQRRDLYKPYAELLVERGAAYYCFCDKQRLESLRQGPDGRQYDGFCARLSQEEIAAKLSSGVPYVIRQKIPPSGTTTFSDMVYGEITVDNSTLDDGVLLKSDGMPTYNFANVVDDHLMGITHVCRGSEYLSSTPKYNLLYAAFGWQLPVYIHMAPIMRDAQHKFSKRAGDPTYEDLLSMGYQREAILNYVALLGWSPGGERELFSLSELVEAFSLSGLSKSPAIFDLQKLDWFNTETLRAMPPADFAREARPFIQASVHNPHADPNMLAALLQPRCEKLCDISGRVDFMDTLPDYELDLYTNKKMKTDPALSLSVLVPALEALEALDPWTQQGVHDALMELAHRFELKNGQVMYPVRVAVSGRASTPGGATELCALLGREVSLDRLRAAIEKLS